MVAFIKQCRQMGATLNWLLIIVQEHVEDCVNCRSQFQQYLNSIQ